MEKTKAMLPPVRMNKNNEIEKMMNRLIKEGGFFCVKP
jgi:hypothetical protein